MVKIVDKLNEMKASYEKVNEIRGSVTHVASTLKGMFTEIKREIESDPLLSPEGKRAKLSEAKKQLGKQFIQQAAKMKDEFQRNVVKVKVGNEVISNEAPPKPTDISIQTFNRELADLKTELLLSINPDSSMNAVKSFVEKQADPYFAYQLKQEFPNIAQSVIGAANGDQSFKLKLRDVYGTINDKSLLPEQKEAAQIAGYLADAFNENLFLERGIEMEAIRNTVGEEFAKYANRPEFFPDDSQGAE